MIKVVFTPHFRKSYKKLVKNSEKLKSVIHEKLKLFERNPLDPSLKNHNLKGKLKGYRAIVIGYDLRAIFRCEDEIVIFFDIGTHDEVYGG
ncbi:MAG: hypothetical protein ACD_28C00158G0001 [uncultured bacterium]|nr:MAG: hypothetical protein ACD_28C00158G0001 [uncultured bacterium]KKT73287.1 MAG: hypothetical protein UW70_C0087G0005 [Candidatus Peregrinibacteria bacterium GW2011_GWA2_44_7]